MKLAIFEYGNYKKFLKDLIDTYPGGGRGQRKALADAIGCQIAYITHVLAGDRHFSLEQAEAAARYFSLSKGETEYLLCLVQENRSGTLELRKFFERQLKEIRDQQSNLKSRLSYKEVLSEEAETIYYSSWQYAAVHVAISIPDLGTVEALAAKLKSTNARILEILEFLCAQGLAYKEQNTYRSKAPLTHLKNDSPLTSRLHANWRLRALNTLDQIQDTDFHYSLVFTIAQKDLPRVREHLMKSFLECAEIIKPSKEEELAGLCMDFFLI